MLVDALMYMEQHDWVFVVIGFVLVLLTALACWLIDRGTRIDIEPIEWNESEWDERIENDRS